MKNVICAAMVLAAVVSIHLASSVSYAQEPIRPIEPQPVGERQLEGLETDNNLPDTGVAEGLTDELLREVENGREGYLASEERRENMENRRENEKTHEGEKPTDAEEDREFTENNREIDASDSEEATEYIHEWVREQHPDIWSTLVNILGAVGAVASIAGLIIVVK